MWIYRSYSASALLAAALATVPAAGQAATQPVPAAIGSFPEDTHWQAVCDQAVAKPLPSAAAALEARSNAAAPDACDEQALYYGFGSAPNYGAALACAYRHRTHPDSPSAGFMDGAGTLAMLYANGDGVPRDYDLSIRFACELKQAAIAEIEERLGRLEALRDGKLPSARFDLCDDQISGAMGGYCSELDLKQADATRARRIAALDARLPEQARAMLQQLRRTEAAFEQARLRGEYMGGGGSGSAGFALDDQNRLREQFVVNLERFDRGRLPAATGADREHALRSLRAAYAAAIAAGGVAGESTIEGMKTTQSAWQTLFAAWMAFLPAADPRLSEDAAATELLRLRIHQLRKAAR